MAEHRILLLRAQRKAYRGARAEFTRQAGMLEAAIQALPARRHERDAEASAGPTHSTMIDRRGGPAGTALPRP